MRRTSKHLRKEGISPTPEESREPEDSQEPKETLDVVLAEGYDTVLFPNFPYFVALGVDFIRRDKSLKGIQGAKALKI